MKIAARGAISRLCAAIKQVQPQAGTSGSKLQLADFGAGIGGFGRQALTELPGIRSVTCFDISSVENRTNKERNEEAGVDRQIRVEEASYTDTGADESTFDIIVSQDAFLHCESKDAILREAKRVLRPGGVFVFTDLIRSESAPERVLAPIYDRLNIESMGSVATYDECAKKCGLEKVLCLDGSTSLPVHYGRAKKVLLEAGPKAGISEGYMKSSAEGLTRWVEGARAGHLLWTLLGYRKPLEE